MPLYFRHLQATSVGYYWTLVSASFNKSLLLDIGIKINYMLEFKQCIFPVENTAHIPSAAVIKQERQLSNQCIEHSSNGCCFGCLSFVFWHILHRVRKKMNQ